MTTALPCLPCFIQSVQSVGGCEQCHLLISLSGHLSWSPSPQCSPRQHQNLFSDSPQEIYLGLSSMGSGLFWMRAACKLRVVSESAKDGKGVSTEPAADALHDPMQWEAGKVLCEDRAVGLRSLPHLFLSPLNPPPTPPILSLFLLHPETWQRI